MLVGQTEGPLRNEFVPYFERTWIGSVAVPPMFPRELWNVRQRTIDNEPRTNNNLGKMV